MDGNVWLRQLSLVEGRDIYEMVQEIGPGENGFNNGLFPIPYEQYPQELEKLVEVAQGLNLPADRVPQTLYWLYDGDQPVGYGKLRPQLNEKLLQSGGHIGYVIRPQARGKGYGKLLLQGLLEKARDAGLDKVLLTCQEGNLASRRVIEASGGNLEYIQDYSCKYCIYFNKPIDDRTNVR